jgi:hypothetical protein
MRTSESIHLRPHDELLRELDKYRRAQANPPSRPKAVEQLLEEALTAPRWNAICSSKEPEKKAPTPIREPGI